MANVLVEILEVKVDSEGNGDSDTARTGENGQQVYDVAKLYQESKQTKGKIFLLTRICTRYVFKV